MKQFFHLVFGAGIETINLLVEAYYFNHQTMAPAYYRPYFYSNWILAAEKLDGCWDTKLNKVAFFCKLLASKKERKKS